MHLAKKVKTCGKDHPTWYDGYYDAEFCQICNIWLEDSCKDPECFFECHRRPIKPYGASEEQIVIRGLNAA